jgi:hypothetical protein
MIRVSELKLPLSQVQYHPEDHTEYLPLEALHTLAARQLGIPERHTLFHPEGYINPKPSS